MSDDLDRLTRALRDTPAPDGDAKTRALAAARMAFAQETAPPVRPTQDQPPPAGIWKRIAPMFATNSLRPALYITSSLVVVGLGVVLTQTAPPSPLSVSEMDSRVVVAPPTPLAPPTSLAPAPAPLADAAVAAAPVQAPAVLPVPVPSPRPAAPPATPQAPMAEAQTAQNQAFSQAILGAISNPQQRSAPAMQRRAQGAAAPASAPMALMAPAAETRFANEDPNPLKITVETPVSTFSVDVDTASYVFLRQFLQGTGRVDMNAIRAEELINYFDYAYPAPTGPHPFAVQTDLAQSPWDADKQILRIALQGAEVETRPPLDLVFLIDTSGSMAAANKLPLLIQSFKLVLPQLTAEDTVSIVTYAGSAGTALEPTPATERETILATLEGLTSGGGTAGAAGLEAAYRLANASEGEDRVRRVMLATDGDFNIGLSGDEALEDFIARQRASGTYLSVLGFGMGGFNDATMQALAQAGNGIAAHIDTLSEARRVLVEQMTSSLVPIADDVKIQVEFNPARVVEYRLIGYETRALARTEFNDDRVDAGEVGAGHQVTALYEITPVGSPAQVSDPLRYGAPEPASVASDELAFVKLRYKQPGAAESILLEQAVPANATTPDDSFRFAMAMGQLAQVLRGVEGAPGPARIETLDAIIALADGARGADADGRRAEAVSLMRTLRDVMAAER